LGRILSPSLQEAVNCHQCLKDFAVTRLPQAGII